MPTIDSAFDRVAERIRRFGPITFDDVMEIALYDPDVGFYETATGAGRASGDFITSPEVGPLYGATLARILDREWSALGCPNPFVVVETGAGPGRLALAIQDAQPECNVALRYVLVDRSSKQRARQREVLDLTAPETVRSGSGPKYVSLEHMPVGATAGLIIANEMLDNLPFRILERTNEGWAAVRVGLDESETSLVERIVPAHQGWKDLAGRLAPDAPPGARIPIQDEATRWLRWALASVIEGAVLVIDYADTCDSMANRDMEWLRTYRDHGPGTGILDNIGDQDLTADVAIDQLARVRKPDANDSQADFLRSAGIKELVEEGRRVWKERAHLGDLEAIKARSRVSEAEALLDPHGLGAFRVLRWSIT